MDNDTQLQDHEKRIRILEESDIIQRIQLTNIEKSQSDIKLILNEQNKEQQIQIRNTTNEIMNMMRNGIVSSNEQKFYNNKQFWILISTILGMIAMYLGLQ